MDEHGDVGSAASVSESSTVTVTRPSGDDTLMENMACEGQIGESYDEGDGEEIMIEVVGSDVFVDGVSGHGDGLEKEDLGGDMEGVVGADFGSREAGDSGGELWDGRTVIEEFQNLQEKPDERSEEALEKEGVEVVPGSSIERTNVVVSQSLEVSIREVGEAHEGKDLEGSELTDGGDKEPGNQSQGTGVPDDEVWNPGIDAVVVPSSPVVEPEGEQGEVVGEEGSKMVKDDGLSCKDENLGGDAVRDGLQSSRKEGSSVIEMIETVSEVSNKDTMSHASPEILKDPVEAVVRGHLGLTTKEENIHPCTEGTESGVNDQNLQSSRDELPMKDDRAADNNASHDNMGAATLAVSNLPNDNADGEVASVDANVSLADSLDTGGKHSLAGENVSTRSVSDVISVTEPEVSIREKEILEQAEIPARDIKDSGVVPEAPFSDEKNETVYHSEDFPSIKEKPLVGSQGDFDSAPESSLEQSAPVGRGEQMAMDIDEVLDFKDEAIVVDAPDASLSSVGNTKEYSGKPTAVDFRVDEGPVESDLGISNEHRHLSTGYSEIIAEHGGANFRGEVLDGHEPILQKEHVNTLDVIGGTEVMKETSVVPCEQDGKIIPMEASVDSHMDVEVPFCDAGPLLAEGNEKLEKGSVSKGEDGILSSPKEGDEVELYSDAIQVTGSNADTNTSIQDQKPVAVETLVHDVRVDQTKNTFVADETQTEGSYAASISNFQVSAGSESAGVSSCSLGKGDIDNFLSDGNENLIVDYSSHETSLPKGDQIGTTSVPEAADKLTENKSKCFHSNDSDMMQIDVPHFKSTEEPKDMGVGKQYPDDELLDYGEQDISSDKNASEMDESKKMEEKTTNLPSFLKIGQDGYFLPPSSEGEFSVTDLVWGKVRSHPWWPGQIFDPADASEKAVKYYKKDCFLVAYFGDHTFAWNDASLLKPFRPHFSHIEKQSNSEAFQNAVSCALDEVSRRVQLGLSCSCIGGDAYGKVECQIVENTGIREESSRRHGVDKSSGAISFEPDKLLQYVRSLAESPFCLADRLELVLAEAQLSTFCRFKGYREPPMFDSRDATFENDARTLASSDAVDQSLLVSIEDEQTQKRKQNLTDDLHAPKERSLSELMGDMEYSADGEALSKSVSITSGKKRKAVDSLTDGSDRRTTFYAAKVSTIASTIASSPKQSFKVGDCIRRVASQLTGSMPILKSHNDQAGTDAALPITEDSHHGTMVVATEISSLEEMLSQLQLAARDPKKGYSFLSNIIIFFSGFRNSVVRKHTSVGKSAGGRKRKAYHTTGETTEEFEFDDVNDSYWKDRIVQNYSEDQLLQNDENGERDYQIVASDPNSNRVHKSGRAHSRKRYSNGNYETLTNEQSEYVDRKKLELSPAELVLTFAEGDRLPSELNLNKMFRRFGPLKESETEVDQDSHRARIIFKKGADAEAACSSAGRINIFGSMVVNYQLSYLPSTTFGSLPLMLLGTEDAT